MKPAQTVLARIAVATLLAGSLVAVVSGPAHAAPGLQPRACKTILTGDKARRLDVCVRGWNRDNPGYVRGVAEIHTYKLLGGINDWVDSRSQSITLDRQLIFRNDAYYADWGQTVTQRCRVDGPGGSVGCSVPNTIRVAFYGPELYSFPLVNEWATEVVFVSWRTDRGDAHRDVFVGSPRHPGARPEA
jgi:hypothetical protein